MQHERKRGGKSKAGRVAGGFLQCTPPGSLFTVRRVGEGAVKEEVQRE